MPIIAESGPIVINPGTPGTGQTPVPTAVPIATPPPEAGTPRTTRTPKPARTPKPSGRAEFAARHQEFLDTIQQSGACFKQADIQGFTKAEFDEHANVAIQDKFLTISGDQYCSMAAVKSMVDAMKRTPDEQTLV